VSSPRVTNGRTETQALNHIPTHQPKFPSRDRLSVAMRTLSGGYRACWRVVTHQRAIRGPRRSFGQRKGNQRIASSSKSPWGVRTAMEEISGRVDGAEERSSRQVREVADRGRRWSLRKSIRRLESEVENLVLTTRQDTSRSEQKVGVELLRNSVVRFVRFNQC
jgi:hypothetical protein